MKRKKNLVEESTEKKNQKLCKYETERKDFYGKYTLLCTLQFLTRVSRPR